MHTPNLPQLLHASIAPESRNHLDGIAVISDIVSSRDPQSSSRRLRDIVDSFKRARKAKDHAVATFSPTWKVQRRAEELAEGIIQLMEVVKRETPLVHQVCPNGVLAPQFTAADISDHQQRGHQRFGECYPCRRGESDHGDQPERLQGSESGHWGSLGQLWVSSTDRCGRVSDETRLTPSAPSPIKKVCLLQVSTSWLSGSDERLIVQVEKQMSTRSRSCLTLSPLAPPLSAAPHRKVCVGPAAGQADVTELLSHWQPTVIKGNAGEIGAMAESTEVRKLQGDVIVRQTLIAVYRYSVEVPIRSDQALPTQPKWSRL